MKKRGVGVLTLFSILFLITSISAEDEQAGDKPIVYVVPTQQAFGEGGPFLLSFERQELFDNLMANGLMQKDYGLFLDFEDYLSDSGLPSPELRGRIFERIAIDQVESLKQVTGEDVELVFVPEPMDVEGWVSNRIDSEISGEIGPKGVMRLARLGKNGGGEITQEELYSAADSLKLGSTTKMFYEAIYRKEIDGLFLDHIAQQTGRKVDPGKDLIVDLHHFSGLPGGPSTEGFTDFGELRVTIGTSGNPEILAHEAHHAGFGSIHNYCDEYNHQLWSISQEELKALGTECTNPYDPLGCCADNPRWWEEGVFDRAAYEKHLNEIGVGPHCYPKKTEDKLVCQSTIDENYKRLNQAYDPSNPFSVPYSCAGNPCETGDPGPPYCRSIMGLAFKKEILTCFGDEEVERKTLKPTAGSSSVTGSPSQN